MAELVGLVASSIALAEVVGKVGGGILRLKRLWDEVKDVPDAIQDLFKRLDLVLPMVARIARDIETGENVLQDMEAVEGCILSCRQVISDEAEMLEDLIVQIDATKRLQRLRDMVRVALKRDVLARHEKKLEGMIQTLMLAHAEYSRAYTKAMPAIIVQQLSASGYVVRQEDDRVEKIAENHDNTISRSRSIGGFPSGGVITRKSSVQLPWKGQSFFGSFTGATHKCQIEFGSSPYETTEHGFRLQLPWWITQRAWELRLLSGWQIHFRTYNVVQPDAPVFKCVEMHDLEGLIGLFKQGKASPFDVTDRGVTVFQVALSMYDTMILRFLIQAGCHTGGPEDFLHATVGYKNAARRTHFAHQGHDLRFAFDTYDNFVVTQGIWDLEDEVSARQARMLTGACSIHVVSLNTILPRISPEHHDKSIIDRLRMIRFATEEFREDTFSLLLWPDGVICLADFQQMQSQGCSLLHIIAHISFRESLVQYLRKFDLLHPPHGDGFGTLRLWRTWMRSEMVGAKNNNDWSRRRCEVIRLTTDMQWRQVDASQSLNGSTAWARKPFETLLLTILNSSRRAIVMEGRTRLICPDGQRRRSILPPKDKMLSFTMMSWLEDVALSGIDLESYGREELALIRGTNCNGHHQYGPLRCQEDNMEAHPFGGLSAGYSDIFRFPKLETFKFGPHPSDWSFIWDWEVEDFAGEFWAAIETPVPVLPGAWVEDQDAFFPWEEDVFDKFLPQTGRE